MILRILPALVLWSLVSCGNKDRAGGTTVETTNGIAGVVEADGKPQAGIRVLVIADSYVPGAGKQETSYIAFTDEEGRFLFPRPPQGRYRIIARDTLSGTAALLETVVHDSIPEEVSLQLEPAGKVRFSLQNLAFHSGDWVALPGSDVAREITEVDLLAGEMILQGVPAGTYGGLYWSSSLEANPPYELVAEPIVMESDAVVQMQESDMIPQSIEIQLADVVFDSASEGVYFPTMLGKPSAVVLEARVRPIVGLLGGEVVSMGNHVGFRMDANDSMVSIYAYSSFEGPSEWMVLSGFVLRTDAAEWINIALLDDPANGRWELWLNGELHTSSPADSLKAISWDKGGTETWIGRHSRFPTQNHFWGEIDWVRVQAIPAADWVYQE